MSRTVTAAGAILVAIMLTVACALLVATSAAAQTTPMPAPSPEAETLGRRVAETGTLATLLPLMTAHGTDELISEHPELDTAAKARLRVSAADTVRIITDRLMTVVGHQYAMTLSIEDLKAVVAFNTSPTAQAWRAAEPTAIMVAVKTLDGFDFKGETWGAYCGSPGVTCPAPAVKAAPKRSQ